MDYLTTSIAAINNAKKPLLQLSGGRDSLCTLFYLFENGCRNFDVVWVNTGDAPQETVRILSEISELFGGRFHVIESDSLSVREQYGVPSPMVRSEESHPVWASCTDQHFHIQPQFECCRRTIMEPMQNFTVDGEYDLVIRGVRSAEGLKSPVEHLASDDNFAVAYPIYDWSDAQVNQFLLERGVLPTFYERSYDGVDCVTCPAFWGNGHQAWVEEHYPEKAVERRQQIERLMGYMSHTIQLGFNELDCRSPNA